MSAIDWDGLKAEYRTGTNSNLALAHKYGVSEGAIRKRAKKDNWPRDLSEAVKRATKEKLVRATVRVRKGIAEPRTDDQVIEDAAVERTEVVLSHRKDITAGRDLVGLLTQQLRDVSIHRETIEQLIADETKADKTPQRRAAMYKAVSLPTNAGTLKDLTVAMRNLIVLERQAYNIGEDSGGGSLEDWLAKLEPPT